MVGSDVEVDEARSAAWPDSQLFISIVTLMDCGLIYLWRRGDISALDAVSAHTATVLLALFASWLIRRSVRTELPVTILLLLFGPLGGPVVAISRLLSRLVRPIEYVPEILDTENAAASLAEEVFDSIRQSRRYNPGYSRLNSFSSTFYNGDDAAQSAAIAAITRRYSPSMRPALDAALSSNNPALRVQAAAVFAKLRTSYSERATEVLLSLQENPRGTTAAKLAKEASTVGKSGFLEAELGQHLIAASHLLESRAQFRSAPGSDHFHGHNPKVQNTQHPPIRRYSCGGTG